MVYHLNLLNISPFSYGLLVENVFDAGSVFSPKVLDITDDDLKATFMTADTNIAAVSLAIGYPTATSKALDWQSFIKFFIARRYAVCAVSHPRLPTGSGH